MVDELNATPLWERLPAREVTPREIAASLPENVPGDYMAVGASAASVEWNLPGHEAHESGLRELVVESIGFRVLELGADGWYKAGRLGPTPDVTTLGEAVDELGFGWSNPVVVARVNDMAGRPDESHVTPREYLVGLNDDPANERYAAPEHEELAEDDARETRQALYEERLKDDGKDPLELDAEQARRDAERFRDEYRDDLPDEVASAAARCDEVALTGEDISTTALGESWTIGTARGEAADYHAVEGTVVDTGDGYASLDDGDTTTCVIDRRFVNADVTPVRPLDTSHGAVKRTAKYAGASPESFETAGDLPPKAELKSYETTSQPLNGVVAYDDESRRVVEYNGMVGEWSPVSPAVFDDVDEAGTGNGSAQGDDPKDHAQVVVCDTWDDSSGRLNASVEVAVPAAPHEFEVDEFGTAEAVVEQGETVELLGGESEVLDSRVTVKGRHEGVLSTLVRNFGEETTREGLRSLDGPETDELAERVERHAPDEGEQGNENALHMANGSRIALGGGPVGPGGEVVGTEGLGSSGEVSGTAFDDDTLDALRHLKGTNERAAESFRERALEFISQN